ncbi:uncharacterized [Tachysurus ichikawai]
MSKSFLSVSALENLSFTLHFTSPPTQPKAETEADAKQPTAQPKAEDPEMQAEAKRTVEAPPDREVKHLKHVTDQNVH